VSAPPDLAALAGIVERRGRHPEALVAILKEAQHEYRHLPPAVLRRVAELTGITPARVAEVASFYGSFRSEPAGRHLVQVCVGTACHVLGAGEVLEEFRGRLGIGAGEDTDAAGLFTVAGVACLGCCSIAPAVRIGGTTYGHVGAGRVAEVLADFLEGEGGAGEREAPRARRGRGPAFEVRLCQCTACLASGAAALRRALLEAASGLGLPLEIGAVTCGGRADEAPLAVVHPPGGGAFRYGAVRAADAEELLLAHAAPRGAVRRGRVAAVRLLERLALGEAVAPVTRFAREHRPAGPHAPDERRQLRIATAGAGEVAPLDLAEYVRRGGFAALARCASELSPEAIVDAVARSGLRGRGGGGYPTGRKWAQVRAAPGTSRFVVANGDEGDPGAFMDRMLLESFPFRVIEGMAVAARAVGAAEGVVYVRSEYPLAVERVGRAIEICREGGYLGGAVCGTDFTFDLRVVEGAGAFVCGEETALIAALEGRRGMPRPRPPYPSEEGFRGLPTLVNNVETFALVPWIVGRGAEAFASIGTPGSPGTKTFALAGKVRLGGLVEVPLGITLREIVEEIGGGVPGGRALKAVQVGGPAGGCVPAHLLDTPVDFEALGAAGAVMGSGGLIALDEADCMVELARYFTAFARRESCGRCTLCRIGTVRLLEMLEDLCAGRGRPGLLERIAALGEQLQAASLCGLGRTAPNTVLSTLRHFRAEYLEHLAGRCPARRCKALIAYRIGDGCIGCTRCAQRCLAGAIEARPHEPHEIDGAACTRCDVCRQVCPVGAVSVETGGGA
jgi:NADH:ubiquinone oxidoreductase subunit F (NADH-binding)/NADH:ubiquinone oxidoreductase subunit E